MTGARMFRTVRRVLVPVLVVTLVAGAGFVSWERWWRRAGPENPGACPAVVPAGSRVPFAASGVHRVALIGDSIMLQASCAVAQSLAEVGIRTSRHAVSGSGLLAGMDWVAETQHILATERPDVVVAIFVGNYLFGAARDASNAIIQDDTPAFFRAWQERARLLSAEVHAAHARMYWVSPPPITDTTLRHARVLFDAYRTIRGDHFLFSGRVMEGPDGGEVMEKQTCGRPRAVRTPDRVHLAPDGARIYGQQIAHDLTADLGVITAPRPC
jgi:hypothetical protein